jgi:hypothetical protein
MDLCVGHGKQDKHLRTDLDRWSLKVLALVSELKPSEVAVRIRPNSKRVDAVERDWLLRQIGGG